MHFDFTQDWFTPHIPVLESVLREWRGQPNVHALEIGSFEGRSACWLLQNVLTHASSSLTCVDTFAGSAEHHDPSRDIDVRSIEERFDHNITVTGRAQQVHKQRGRSQDVLPMLSTQYFDVVYVDGSHIASDVLCDIVQGWRLLKVGGVMVMDDYEHSPFTHDADNPKCAIDSFLQVFHAEVEVLHRGWQLIVRKRSADHPRVRTATYQHAASPKLIGLSWVRNEADIIAPWVRHNLAVLDRMIVVLHNSTDATKQILQNLQAEGYALDIRTSSVPYHAQGPVLTDVLHTLNDTDYWWCIPIDADEFLWSNDGKPRNHLLSAPRDTALAISWKTYVPTPQDDTNEPNPCHRLAHCRPAAAERFRKMLIPRAIAQQATLKNGNHQLVDAQGVPLPQQYFDEVFLAHFPVRSADQLRQKVVQSWKNSSANPAYKPGDSFQWQQLYDRCQDSSPISAKELQTIALRYALKPEEPTPPLLYDPLYTLPPRRGKSVVVRP